VPASRPRPPRISPTPPRVQQVTSPHDQVRETVSSTCDVRLRRNPAFGACAATEREGNNLKGFQLLFLKTWLTPQPESGLDSLTCAGFVRQRRTGDAQQHLSREKVRVPRFFYTTEVSSIHLKPPSRAWSVFGNTLMYFQIRVFPVATACQNELAPRPCWKKK